MFDRILVPVDIGSDADPAPILKIAKTFAADYGSQITILNVIPTIPGYIEPHLPNNAHDHMVGEVRTRLGKIRQDNDLPEGTVIAVTNGQPAKGILSYAENHNIEGIVIASHDPGVADYLLGSTAARVVRHAHCSVFVVRNLTD